MTQTGVVDDALQIRVHGEASLPTLIYLPGLHGDWTLVSSFRAAVRGRLRFVEFSYPRTTAWSLDDYAAAIERSLAAHGIENGWLLGESFGSQIAWQIIQRAPASRAADRPRALSCQGLILAGGFVKHPWPWGVVVLQSVTGAVSRRAMRGCFYWYARYAKFRHRRAPETLSSIDEFVANRLRPGDRDAVTHRLDLIKANDPRAAARRATLPVFYLAGLVDPLVPWCYVRRWLRRNCPGYRVGKTFWRADHNVLGTAPLTAAQVVCEWMRTAAD